MAREFFRSPESFEEETKSREMLRPFLEEWGVTQLEDKRKAHGKTIEG